MVRYDCAMAVANRVGVVLLPGVLPLDASLAIQGFTAPGYEVVTCAATPSVVGAGVEFSGLAPLASLAATDTVVVPGYADHLRPPEEAVLGALRASAAEGRRMVSICTGAFALAAAGVLDGRPATTHWQATDDLRRLFPLVDVQPSRIFVDDGDVLTSAGVLAGLDLCLHIIRRDRGAAAARDRARALVAPLHRVGSQSAYAAQLAPDAERDEIAEACRSMMASLDTAHDVDSLAQRAHMSRRTFIRRFTASTGIPPMRWLTLARVDAARALLETTSWTVDRIGEHTGLGPGPSIRSAFHRHVGCGPNAYRAAFASHAAAPGDS